MNGRRLRLGRVYRRFCGRFHVTPEKLPLAWFSGENLVDESDIVYYSLRRWPPENQLLSFLISLPSSPHGYANEINHLWLILVLVLVP